MPHSLTFYELIVKKARGKSVDAAQVRMVVSGETAVTVDLMPTIGLEVCMHASHRPLLCMRRTGPYFACVAQTLTVPVWQVYDESDRVPQRDLHTHACMRRTDPHCPRMAGVR